MGNGEPVVSGTLAADADLSLFPIDVIQLQVHHFSGAQAEPCQKEEDRIIALTHRGVLTARLEQTLDVLRLKKPG
jgi:hypothetical protein